MVTKVLKKKLILSLYYGIFLFIHILLIEEADTDLETDRLLGQQRTDDVGFFDDKTVSFNNFLYKLFSLYF